MARTVGKVAEDKELASIAVVQGPAKEFIANGAIDTASGLKVLTKPSAGAYTLAALKASLEGTVTLVSNTAFAHVVTATGLLDNGVVGGAKSTMTFAAFVGANIRLVAYKGRWIVVASQGVTVS